jgi:hypothetical protein
VPIRCCWRGCARLRGSTARAQDARLLSFVYGDASSSRADDDLRQVGSTVLRVAEPALSLRSCPLPSWFSSSAPWVEDMSKKMTSTSTFTASRERRRPRAGSPPRSRAGSRVEREVHSPLWRPADRRPHHRGRTGHVLTCAVGAQAASPRQQAPGWRPARTAAARAGSSRSSRLKLWITSDSGWPRPGSRTVMGELRVADDRAVAPLDRPRGHAHKFRRYARRARTYGPCSVYRFPNPKAAELLGYKQRGSRPALCPQAFRAPAAGPSESTRKATVRPNTSPSPD